MKKDIILLAALSFLVFLLLSPLLFGWLGVFTDDYYETFSRLCFNARSIQGGALPLWDPHVFAGGRVNFLPNTDMWYWPHYPFFSLVDLRNLNAAYTVLMKLPLVLHWIFCALAAYGLGRWGIRLHPVGAALGATIYALGGGMAYNICDPATVYAVVWVPMALWGIIAFAWQGKRWLGIAAAASIAFLGPCGSDVRAVFSLLTVIIALTVISLVFFRSEGGRKIGRLLLLGALVFIIGLLLSGPYWAAMYQVSSIYRSGSLLDLSRSASEAFSMPWHYLVTILVPDFYGTLTNHAGVDLGISDLSEYSYIEGNLTGGYWLVMIWALGIAAAWRSRKLVKPTGRLGHWFLVGVLLYLFSILLVTGRYSPFYRLLARSCPVFSLPYAARWRVLQHLGSALITGVTVHWFWTARRSLSRKMIATVLLSTLILVGWQGFRFLSPGPSRVFSYGWDHYRSWLLRGPLLYLLLLSAGSLWLLWAARKRYAPAVLLAAVLGESTILAFLVIYFLSWGRTPEWVHYKSPVESEFFRWTEHPSLFNHPSPRSGPLRACYYFSMLDQVATLHGGDYLLGHNSKPLLPRLRRILQKITIGYPYALRLTHPRSKFFSNMSVRHLVLDRPDALPPELADSRLLPGNKKLYGYQLKTTLPRAFTQDRVVECAPDEARHELLSGDLRRAAFLEESKRLAVSGERSAGNKILPNAEVISYKEFREREKQGMKSQMVKGFKELQKLNRIERVWLPSPNRMNILIEVKKPALLVTTDIFYPGWRVSVDGQPETPLRVNYLQRGVWLDKGTHKVQWVFRPPAVKWGFMLLGLGFIGLVGLVIWPRRKLKI